MLPFECHRSITRCYYALFELIFLFGRNFKTGLHLFRSICQNVIAFESESFVCLALSSVFYLSLFLKNENEHNVDTVLITSWFTLHNFRIIFFLLLLFSLLYSFAFKLLFSTFNRVNQISVSFHYVCILLHSVYTIFGLFVCFFFSPYIAHNCSSPPIFLSKCMRYR